MNDSKNIYRLDYENEIKAFSQEHQSLMGCIPKMNASANGVFQQIQITTDDRLGVVISQLARICNRHFEAVLLLATTGHGYSAGRTVRSLFEKAVDAKYLHQFPDELDDFFDYYVLQLHERGEATDIDKPDNWERFYNKGGLRPRWSKTNVVEKARAVEMTNFLENTYKHGHLLIHSSMHEVLGSFMVEEDGTLSPSTPERHREHEIAYASLLAGAAIMVNVLDLTIEHFGLDEPQHFREFQNCLINSLK